MKEGMEKKNPWAFGDEAEKIEKARKREDLEPVLKAAYAEFRQLLEEEGDISETIPLKPSSDLLDISKARIDGLVGFIVPDDLARSTEYRVYAPDDARRAALECMREHPEVTFDFNEDRTKGIFSYTAKLRQQE